MDPDETLKALRRAVLVFRAAEANSEQAAEGDSNDAEIFALQACAAAGAEVVELAQALDGWISKGGFLPAEWTGESPSDPDLDEIDHWRRLLNRAAGDSSQRAALGGELNFKVKQMAERRPDLASVLRDLKRRLLIECLGVPAEIADRHLEPMT